MSFSLHAGARQIDLSTPVCMGVINATPDSFSDGSQLGSMAAGEFHVNVDKALRRAEAMVAEGAMFIDVGGESTRPGAEAVPPQRELDRVLPVIEAIRANLDVCISLDSSSPEVITAAIEAGAELINDIRALNDEQAMKTVSESQAAVCLMHMQGEPRTMQQTYSYQDLVREVTAYLEARVRACTAVGIDRSRLLVDPGFGFGKSLSHNFKLLRDLDQLTTLNLPILIGISRKSMIGAVTGRPVDERLPGSLAASVLALSRGARIVRSHDVAATVDAIRVHCACLA